MSDTGQSRTKTSRFGMVIDIDKCNGCGDCMVACAVENNVPPVPAAAGERKAITWLKVYRVSNGQKFPDHRSAFIPISCQQCGEHTPCVSVCPQQAVDVDPKTGIVGQMPERCLGCRYCMAACPYHARYFNWWDPVWPAGMEKALNPQVSPRMRGVVEKCNFCHGRYQAARAKAAAEGRKELSPGEYTPACVEACPTGAVTFGDLADPTGEAYRMASGEGAFRLLESLGTQPKVYYLTRQPWIRQIVEKRLGNGKEEKHG